MPPPEDLPSEAELKNLLMERLPEPVKAYWQQERPIEIRPVDLSRYLSPESQDPSQLVWIRATAALGNDPALHQCVMAYASDFTLLDTALIAHGRFVFDPKLMLASLDHAVWFHESFRADDWLLYARIARVRAPAGRFAGARCSRVTAAWWPPRRKKASFASVCLNKRLNHRQSVCFA